MKSTRKIRVGIFGSGNIGTDLLVKLSKVPEIEVVFVVGRRSDSPGILLGQKLNIKTNIDGIAGLKFELAHSNLDWLADTSSAKVHELVIDEVKQFTNCRVLDFTPSELSKPFVPLVDQDKKLNPDNGLISCGAQSSIPLIHILLREFKFKRIELVSSLAAKSVGPATRKNLDEYINKTEKALAHYGKCDDVKAILIINPANPPINMGISLYLKPLDRMVEPSALERVIQDNLNVLKIHIPNFRLVSPCSRVNDELLVSFEVTGSGDYLPPYAGNLDVLTHAAKGIIVGRSL